MNNSPVSATVAAGNASISVNQDDDSEPCNYPVWLRTVWPGGQSIDLEAPMDGGLVYCADLQWMSTLRMIAPDKVARYRTYGSGGLEHLGDMVRA